MKRFIFHVPYNLDLPISSGSYNRPRQLRKAFQSFGFSFLEISGTYKKRKKLIDQAIVGINNGEFSFIYSESATIPTLLSNELHMPLKKDLELIKSCSIKGMKVGLFYRDIHWQYLTSSTLKYKLIALYYKPFYKLDLSFYKKCVNVLFLPSDKMIDYIPFTFDCRVVSLPSGGNVDNGGNTSKSCTTNGLNLFYVGGVSHQNGLYDISLLFSQQKFNNISLTISCRKGEWDTSKGFYLDGNQSNINIVHLSGGKLKQEMQRSDVAFLYYPPHKYREFAFPFKVFEYLFNGLPIIANEGTPVADFIIKNNIGWVIPYSQKALEELLSDLENNKLKVETCKANINNMLADNTWEARANTIIKELS